MQNIIKILGWIGVFLVLSAYFLINFYYISSKSIIYLLLNIFGSIFIFVETFHKKDYQPALLNLIWLGIALVAIIKTL